MKNHCDPAYVRRALSRDQWVNKLGFCTAYNINGKQLMFCTILVFTNDSTLHYFFFTNTV